MNNQDINKDIASKAAKRFGTNFNRLKKIEGGCQNLIYEYINDGKPYILRITNASTRTLEQIQSEIDFIIHLADNKVTASIPVRSVDYR